MFAKIQKTSRSYSRMRDLVERKLLQEGFKLVEIHVEPGSAKGDNYLGIISRVSIKARNCKGEPFCFSWIVKTASENVILRRLISVRNAFLREIHVYATVIPQMKLFQDEHKVLEPFENIPVVKTYDESIPERVVMVDLRSSGFIMANRKRPLDFDHVKLAVKEYGHLHALSFAMRKIQPEEFRKLSDTLDETFLSAINKQNMEKTVIARNEMILRVLQSDDEKYTTRFKKYTEHMLDDIINEISIKSVDEYSVIGHGDSNVNNVLFKYEQSLSNQMKPVKVSFLDFQMCRYGSVAHDLLYFIFTSTDKAFRDEHYDDILRIYHDAVCNFLGQFKCDGRQLFPYSAFEDQIKRFTKFSFMMTSSALHLLMSEDDEVPDLDEMKEDDDLDSFLYTSVNEEAYLRRMRDIVVDFVDKGYM